MMKFLSGQIAGPAALSAGTPLGLELVDEIDDVEEAATSAIADAGAGDRIGEMGLAGAADEDDVALASKELAAGKVADQGLIDRRVGKDEVIAVLGERQLGGRDLVLDRAVLLLGNLGGEHRCWRFTAVAMISSKTLQRSRSQMLGSS